MPGSVRVRSEAGTVAILLDHSTIITNTFRALDLLPSFQPRLIITSETAGLR